ncbi:hypothetical protein [Aurantimonas sp. VKM B-3413]|uniref:hypothetical protein n=1 Tax=Aurantimonas sp. VKM B-3413 TaxID=2779401 RepID=UPI001E3340D4|nr:hypothetical protein [Aurantimonas sp. VKM B-3413]MCB8837005.1 hypothetical protein [Aurantimonas sp. VKM B-3413]
MATYNDERSAVDALCVDGLMTMLAIDQRGSMRTILAAGRSEDAVSDADVSDFKKTAVDVLAPMASGVLLDLEFGQSAIAALPRQTPLILSADLFDQPRGQAVQGSRLDPDVTEEAIQKSGASAIKFLSIWKSGVDVHSRSENVSKFVKLARDAGVVSLLEAIVRQPDGSGFDDPEAHGDAVLAAADELAAFGPDVYKAEVPAYRKGDLSRVEAFSKRLSERLTIPWVVLSSGVDASDFPEAVRLAVSGGASGFLCGRAIWADAARSDNPHAQITELSIGRFAKLIESAKAGRHA